MVQLKKNYILWYNFIDAPMWLVIWGETDLVSKTSSFPSNISPGSRLKKIVQIKKKHGLLPPTLSDILFVRLFVCKQSTNIFTAPCISSVQKYKYMLSLQLRFFFRSHI